MIAVIDYSIGNLRSVCKALEKHGEEVRLTREREVILSADSLVLPGVGAFSEAMKNLQSLGLIHPVRSFIESGKPFLGICLGFQLLFTESEEDGLHPGLDIFKGKVRSFSANVKIPHIGWNTVRIKKENPLFRNIPDNSHFYFVHSYYVQSEDADIVAGTTEYDGEFCSMIQCGNVYGTQFHPEKSTDIGLRMLENFCEV